MRLALAIVGGKLCARTINTDCCCATELVEFIVAQGKLSYEGTDMAVSFVIYHVESHVGGKMDSMDER